MHVQKRVYKVYHLTQLFIKRTKGMVQDGLNLLELELNFYIYICNV